MANKLSSPTHNLSHQKNLKITEVKFTAKGAINLLNSKEKSSQKNF